MIPQGMLSFVEFGYTYKCSSRGAYQGRASLHPALPDLSLSSAHARGISAQRYATKVSALIPARTEWSQRTTSADAGSSTQTKLGI